MSSQSTFGLTFYINRSKEKKNGECPVMMRISINGQKLAVQVQRFIKPAEWDAKKYQMIGRTKEARIFNDFQSVKSGQTDPLFFIESDPLLFGGYCPPLCVSFSEQTDPLRIIFG